jgi:hypothetical protein
MAIQDRNPENRMQGMHAKAEENSAQEPVGFEGGFRPKGLNSAQSGSRSSAST